MKLQKKFAVLAANFIADYLDHGYYPVDDTVDESSMISKILGFARYHGQFHDKDIDAWIERIESLPFDEPTARLDLTSAEGCGMLDMMNEASAEIGQDTYKTLHKYLSKFTIDADNSESDKGK